MCCYAVFVSVRRTLTGAWIETIFHLCLISSLNCRTLTGAWIETSVPSPIGATPEGRTLTGAWIETLSITLL